MDTTCHTSRNTIVPKWAAVVKHGLSVVAVANKRPVTKWEHFQRQPQTDTERNEQLALVHAGKASAIGLVCGIGGLVNIDIDADAKDNPVALPVPEDIPRDILTKLNLPWPYAWAWRSVSGKGWHIWLVVEDLPGNATRKENTKPEYPAVKTIEIRAWKHYSVVPPAVRIPEEPPATVSWGQLCRAVGITERTTPTQRKTKAENSLRAYAQERLEHWLNSVTTAPVRTRNNTLNLAAFELGRFVGAQALDETDVRTKLFEAATKRKQDPIPTREALATIESGVTDGKQEPFTPADIPQRNKEAVTVAKGLVALAVEHAEFFTNVSGRIAYARITVQDHKECVLVESQYFEDWLTGLYYNASEGNAIPGSEALKNVIRLLSYKARAEGERKEIYTRVAPDGEGGIYIDMADQARRIIHVTKDGWRIINDAPVAFMRSETMRALPEPQRGGSLEALRAFININDNESWALIKAWLTTALLPDIPYPVLVLLGEQGSAKSTMAEMLRSLIDPAYPLLRRPPRDQESIHIAAQSCWVVAIDNVSTIPGWLSDDICSLVTGSGIAKRRLYTNTEEVVTYAKRPFILNGITDFIQRGDLLDRALIVEAPHIPDHKRVDKATLQAEFEKQSPYILGALLDRLAGALRERPYTQLRDLPRMADFTLYAVAAEKAELGAAWNKEQSEFLRGYNAVRENALEQQFEVHVVGPALHAWLRDAVLPWENTATVLLKEIESKATEKNDRSVRMQGWPHTPHALRCALRRLMPALRSEGYVLTFTRTRKGRFIRIEKEHYNQEDPPPQNNPTPSSENTDTKKNAGEISPTPVVSGCSPAVPQRITWLETAHDVEEAMRDIMAQPTVGFDIETTGLNPREHRIRLVQLATPTCVYLLDAFKTDVRLLERVFNHKEGAVLAGHKLQFDLAFLRRVGIDSPNGSRLFDTLLASRLLTAGLDKVSHKLAAVVQRYLGKHIDKTQQQSDWNGDLSQEQIYYAAHDAAIMLPLSAALGEDLFEADLLTAADIEMRALPAVVWMEDTGVGFDRAAWEAQAAQLQEKLAQMDTTLAELAGTTINWSSGKQLLKLLTARGLAVADTKEDTLKPFAATDQFVAALLQRKHYAKRLSSFGLNVLTFVAPDGRIHPEFDQTGTATGRMSCKDPNIQQIPRDPEYRRCFTAPDGRVLIKTDYSQIELRIAAEITQDPRMLEAYQNNLDLHRLTAHLVLGAPMDKIDKKQRQAAKALNFGLLYGMGYKTLQHYAVTTYNAPMTLEEAEQFRGQFFATYKGLRAWHYKTGKNKGAETVYTLSGRRRLNVEKFTEKLNTPVQGTGADGLKAALALLWEERDTCPSVAPVLAVHDEIVIECDRAEAEKAKEWLEDCMKRGMAQFLRNVPVEVESVICKDWSGTPLDEQT